MAKKKKDAITKVPGKATGKKLARFKATAEEARTRTAKVKETFITMGKLWWELGAEVKACIDDFVPEALGKKATEWFKDCFGDSWLKVYRAHRAVAALPGIPKAKLEKITEGNAYQLARLPKLLRSKPEWIDKAISLPNEEFKEVVENKRTPKGMKRDPMVKWNEIFRITSVPKTLAKLIEHALKLAGKNSDQDLDTKEGRINCIELIFSEFVTSQVQPEEIVVRPEDQLQQAEQAGEVADQTFGSLVSQEGFESTEATKGEYGDEQSMVEISDMDVAEAVEERPTSRRRKKASAA